MEKKKGFHCFNGQVFNHHSLHMFKKHKLLSIFGAQIAIGIAWCQWYSYAYGQLENNKLWTRESDSEKGQMKVQMYRILSLATP